MHLIQISKAFDDPPIGTKKILNYRLNRDVSRLGTEERIREYKKRSSNEYKTKDKIRDKSIILKMLVAREKPEVKMFLVHQTLLNFGDALILKKKDIKTNMNY